MADAFGALELPVPVAPGDDGRGIETNAVSDPCLEVLLAFFQAVLNAECNAAWQQRGPVSASEAATQPRSADVCAYVFAHDPTNPRNDFNPKLLPALFLFRTGEGEFEDTEEDGLYGRERLRLWWVAPDAQPNIQRQRAPLINGISKALVTACKYARHPAFTLSGDEADLDAIKTQHATSTAEQVYSGAALDGVIGATTVHGPRPVSVTTSARPGVYNTTAPIVFRGLLVGDVEHEESLYLTTPNGGETVRGIWEFKSISSVTEPPQLSGAGTFWTGYAASADLTLGALVKRVAGLSRLALVGPGKPRMLEVGVTDGTERVVDTLKYSMIEFSVAIEEQERPDLAGTYTSLLDAQSGNGANVSFTYGNGDNEVFMTAQLPNP